jgi:hypothetical protein
MRRRGVTRALVVVLCASWMIVVRPGPVLADMNTYGSTGGEQTFTVPDGVTTLHVHLVGGQGGSPNPGGAGGHGADVVGDLGVSPGEVLYLYVAGNGSASGSGGFNGGGAGGAAVGVGHEAGGGGGGGTDIRTGHDVASRILVAGGGAGGGTGSACTAAKGGDAGADGSDCNLNPGAGYLGHAGTATAGGAGGVSGGPQDPASNGLNGTLGTGGAGGHGDNSTDGDGGGGGGGGLYGGGGGGGSAGSGGAGGGGGSSYVGAGVTNASTTTDGSGTPLIAISWTPPAPASGGPIGGGNPAGPGPLDNSTPPPTTTAPAAGNAVIAGSQTGSVLVVTVTINHAGTVVDGRVLARLPGSRRPILVGSVRRTVPAAGVLKLKVQLNKRGRAALKRLHRLRLTLRLRFSAEGATPFTVTKQVVLKR